MFIRRTESIPTVLQYLYRKYSMYFLYSEFRRRMPRGESYTVGDLLSVTVLVRTGRLYKLQQVYRITVQSNYSFTVQMATEYCDAQKLDRYFLYSYSWPQYSVLSTSRHLHTRTQYEYSTRTQYSARSVLSTQYSYSVRRAHGQPWPADSGECLCLLIVPSSRSTCTSTSIY